MKPYIIIYEKGNGYHCGCCRRTYTETDTMEFESDADAKAYAEVHNENNKTNRDQDSEITSIYALADINPVF